VARREVVFAASLNKRFAPIVFRPVDSNSVPEELAKLHFISFDDPVRFDAGVDQLAKALETDIGWIRQHTEYGEAERRWSLNSKPGGLLLHSPTLEVAEHWIASHPRGVAEPTEQVKLFVAASRRRARLARRMWQLVLGSTFTLLIGIILGLVAWINQDYIKAQWLWYTAARPYMLSQVRPYVLAASRETALKPGDTFKECANDCPEMVVVPAGEFMMGAPPNGSITDILEGPQHKVTIAKPFAIGKFEVTFAEWDVCVSVGGCPPEGVQATEIGWGRGRQPIIYVSWNQAQAYVAWLSKMTGKTYRLLTEAEWEYAARAGTTTVYYWGAEIGQNNANCRDCGDQWTGRPKPVGSFPPNPFGLYDMLGNLWEWVEDCHHISYEGAPIDGSAWTSGDCKHRTSRGGSWVDGPQSSRSTSRGSDFPAASDDGVGFRIGRTMTP
jgi:formylglycine-generating enzyme required for sulfatase activity